MAARTGIAAMPGCAAAICRARPAVRRSSILFWRIAGALARLVLGFPSVVFLPSHALGHLLRPAPAVGHATPRACGPDAGTPAPWPIAAGTGGRSGTHRRRRGGACG